MNVIIGEIIATFSVVEDESGRVRNPSSYIKGYSGSLINMAQELKMNNKDFEIVTKIGGDKLSEPMETIIESVFDKSLKNTISSPYLSAVKIDGDLRLSGTAPATIGEDELAYILSNLKPTSVVISGTLLSVNPASNSIVDSISFLDSKPKVFIDLASDITSYMSIELLHKAVKTVSALFDTYIIGDIVSDEKATKIEKSHLCDYLD